METMLRPTTTHSSRATAVPGPADRRARHADARRRTPAAEVTTDLPVIDAPRDRHRAGAQSSVATQHRPAARSASQRSGTQRQPLRRSISQRPVAVRASRPQPGLRRPVGAAVSSRPPARRAAGGTRCADRGARPQGALPNRRRAAAVAVLTGVALAMLVWLIGVAGAGIEDSSTPAPAATQVVHVRSGETLDAVAARVAPDLPRQAVIAQIIELNDMSSVAVRVGQPLVAPSYR